MKLNIAASVCALLFLRAAPGFGGEIVDFDGKTGGGQKLGALLSENVPVGFPGLSGAVAAELDAKCFTLSETGEWSKVEPVKSWIGANGVRVNQYAFFPGVKSRWQTRCAKGKWTAKETYNFEYDQFAGHYHYEPAPPPLSVSSVTVSTVAPPATSFYPAPSPIIFPEMQMNTTYYQWKIFPSFATRIVAQFESSGACQGTQINYIDVQVQGLLEMEGGQNYYLDWTYPGEQDYHPVNHYGSQKLIDSLVTVANEYKTAFPDSGRLIFQDMSLPWGGVFDLNYDWKEPHYGHTIGADADINRAAVPQENRQRLLEIMCGLTPGVFLERDIPGEPPHYHLRVYGGTEFRPDDFIGSDKGVLGCCKGNVVDPANLQACISARN